MIKYALLLVVAVSIDTFQFLILVGFTGLGAAVTYIIGWVPWIGQIAAGAVDMGLLLFSVVLDFTMSAIFGTGFIALLHFQRLMSIKDLVSHKRTPFIVAKLLPFADALPLYTGMTVWAIVDDIKKKRQSILTGTTPMGAGTKTNPQLQGNIEEGSQAQKNEQGGTARKNQPALQRNIDGIKSPEEAARGEGRGANDNIARPQSSLPSVQTPYVRQAA